MMDNKFKNKFFANKKADIAITILVLAVLILCITALLIFYINDKKSNANGIYANYLNKVYSDAESVRFSGIDLVGKYNGASFDGASYKIERAVKDGDEVFLKINYRFEK